MRQPADRVLPGSRWADALLLALLAIAVFALFQTSPRAGDFWFSDAPRHAMDGAFYYDMARDLPLAHFRRWAIDYYLQYPALTVLTYPPLFALVEAVFFSVFGVSHATAQLTVSAFFLATAYGSYFLTRRWVCRVAAFSTTLLLIGTPIMVFWGRQVMLEIPTFAFLMWSCYFFFRYLDSARPRDLFLVVGFVLAAAYTKQPAIFIAPAYLLTLYFVGRNAIFRRRELWRSAVLFVVGIVPLATFTWMWGRVNVQQATGSGWVKHSRYLIPARWVVVARQWPHQVGWFLLALAIVYCIGAVLWRKWRLPRAASFFFVAWILTGYCFFTLLALHHNERYSMFLIFPLVFFAVLAIVRGLTARIAPYIVIVLAVGTFIHTLLAYHVPYVSGYWAAAQYVCSVAPAGSVVLFSGIRDGSFIFNIRSTPECKNLTVIRSDKLLLRVAVNRQLFGVKELGISESQFKDMLGHYGVRYIVLEPNFWNDLPSMQMLVRVLHQDQFRLLTSVPVASNRNHDDPQLEIYKNLGPIAEGKNLLRLELPVSGITVEGMVGQER